MNLRNGKLVTRERLLKAAIELFAKDGFEGVSVADICDLAEANIASVNYHFGDKKGLFFEALKKLIQDLEERYPIPENLDNLELQDKIECVVDLLLQRACGSNCNSIHPGELLKNLSLETEMFRDIKREFMEPKVIQFSNLLRPYFGNRGTDCDVNVTSMICIFVCTNIRASFGQDHSSIVGRMNEQSNEVVKQFLLAGIQARKKEIENREKETI